MSVMHGGSSYIASLGCQNILICNVNLPEREKTTSHGLKEDLLVFHYNLRRQPPLLTFIYTEQICC